MAKEICRELKSQGMSDEEIAFEVYGEVNEWTLICVEVLTTTAVQYFFEKLFEIEDDFRARCFVANKCRPLVI